MQKDRNAELHKEIDELRRRRQDMEHRIEVPPDVRCRAEAAVQSLIEQNYSLKLTSTPHCGIYTFFVQTGNQYER